jgi:DNA-binding MarR family transcriptional regulator
MAEAGGDPSYEQLQPHLDAVAGSEANRSAGMHRPITRHLLGRLAGRIYDERRTRADFLEPRLFGEPAWDMLLALTCLPPRGQLLTPTALSAAAGVSAEAGKRWQAALAGKGLIEVGPDGVEPRLRTVRLTGDGRALMTRYLTALHLSEARSLAERDDPHE